MTKNARITTGLLSKAKRGDFDQFLIEPLVLEEKPTNQYKASV
jgi:hypothetical protein